MLYLYSEFRIFSNFACLHQRGGYNSWEVVGADQCGKNPVSIIIIELTTCNTDLVLTSRSSRLNK